MQNKTRAQWAACLVFVVPHAALIGRPQFPCFFPASLSPRPRPRKALDFLSSTVDKLRSLWYVATPLACDRVAPPVLFPASFPLPLLSHCRHRAAPSRQFSLPVLRGSLCCNLIPRPPPCTCASLSSSSCWPAPPPPMPTSLPAARNMCFAPLTLPTDTR